MRYGIIHGREGKVSSSTAKEGEFDMGSSHSSGPSSYRIAATQAKAEQVEKERLAAEKAGKIAAANASATADNGEEKGGASEPYKGGALSQKRNKTSTLAGEGKQTFGQNGSLGG